MFTKDGLKETLYDVLGVGDRPWTKRLGVAAFALLNDIVEATLEGGSSLIIEGNLDATYASPELSRIVGAAGASSLVVTVTADAATAAARFRARAGTPERHPGHPDADFFGELETVLSKPYQPPDLRGGAMVVDLSDLSRFDAALDEVAQALEVAAPEAAEDGPGE